MKRECYARPAKPRQVVRKIRSGFAAPDFRSMPAPLEVCAATECHATPGSVAARMTDYLTEELLAWEDAGSALHLLEPSAGTGALIQAMIDKGRPAKEIFAIERHADLCLALKRRFEQGLCGLEQTDFLEWSETTTQRFDGIIMNPPFRKVRHHITAALNLLDANKQTALVALVPITYDHPEAEILEVLPADTFANTTVNTKIIRITRLLGYKR